MTLRSLGLDFIAGDVSTGFIETHSDQLTDPPKPSSVLLQEVADKLLFNDWGNLKEWIHRAGDLGLGTMGFRANRRPNLRLQLYLDGTALDPIDYDVGLYDSATLWEVSNAAISDRTEATFFEGGAAFTFTRWPKATSSGAASSGSILSPMPGRIIAVEVAAGDTVTKGQKLLTLEAMKMEHSLTAPFDGVVAELNASVGGQVQVEALLVRVEKGEA